MYSVVHTTVFSAGENGGNPCPVVLGADALTTEQMQEMTRQFQQESAFLMPATRPDCDWKVRYFVPTHEMEMCVHATIACTHLLSQGPMAHRSAAVLETLLGPINVSWRMEGDGLTVSVNQFLPQVQDERPTDEELCQALCISPEELGTGAVRSVSTSRFKLLVPLRRFETVEQLTPDYETLWALCDKYHTTGFYPFAPENCGDGTVAYHARQFPNRSGYPEDPATGVAASALGAYLAMEPTTPPVEGWNTYEVLQGWAMGRPSRLLSEVCVEHGAITATRVCGRAEVLPD